MAIRHSDNDGGLDYAAVTVKAHGSKGQAEEVPFLFSAKSLAVSGPASGMGGTISVPSYRGSTFMDTIGRGGATGWDWQKVRPQGPGTRAGGRPAGASGRRLCRRLPAAAWPRLASGALAPRKRLLPSAPTGPSAPHLGIPRAPCRACLPLTRTSCSGRTTRRLTRRLAQRALR